MSEDPSLDAPDHRAAPDAFPTTPRPQDPLVAVLAGGGSRRFGRPKEVAELAGRPMIAYPVAAASEAGFEVVVIGGDPALAEQLGLDHVPDEVGVVGPMSGLLSALRRARRQGRRGVLLVGADMPLLPSEFLRALAMEATRQPSRAVGVRSADGRVQTLGAYYPTSALERIARVAVGPKPSLQEAFASAHGRCLQGATPWLRPFDLERAFFNVNTPEDLARASAILD